MCRWCDDGKRERIAIDIGAAEHDVECAVFGQGECLSESFRGVIHVVDDQGIGLGSGESVGVGNGDGDRMTADIGGGRRPLDYTA